MSLVRGAPACPSLGVLRQFASFALCIECAPMASKLLAPVLALVIAVSGIVRGDAVRGDAVRWDAAGWDVTRLSAIGTASSSNKPTVLAAAQGCLWNCASAPVVRGRELARRTCGAGQGQFLACCTVAFNRLPSLAAVSSLCSPRTSSRLITLHHLQVKLQV